MSYEDLQKTFLKIHAPALKNHNALIQQNEKKKGSVYTTPMLLTVGWFGFLYFTGLLEWIFDESAFLLIFGVTGLIWGTIIVGRKNEDKGVHENYNQHFQSNFIDLFLSKYHFNLDWQQEDKFYYKEFQRLGLSEVFGEVDDFFDCSLSFKHKHYPYHQTFIQYKALEENLDVKGCLYVFDYPQAIKAETILSARSSILAMNQFMLFSKKKKFNKADPSDLDESMKAYPFFQLWSNNTSHSYSIFNDALKQIFGLLTEEELKSSTFIWTKDKLILFIPSAINQPFSIDVIEEFISRKKYAHAKTVLTLGQEIAKILYKPYSNSTE